MNARLSPLALAIHDDHPEPSDPTEAANASYRSLAEQDLIADPEAYATWLHSQVAGRPVVHVVEPRGDWPTWVRGLQTGTLDVMTRQDWRAQLLRMLALDELRRRFLADHAERLVVVAARYAAMDGGA